MGEDDTRLVEVNVRRLPWEVRQRAENEVKRLGYRSIHAYVRIKIFELAGIEE
ncbi:hypothetical protein LCGC14_1959170 [marine sediment metagenome]|uniref:Uncharacterized protein n=1 Tax=marine sediment metagenome TaxID=412755 RepID=A0A0F9G3G1_9ZZZZ